MVNVEENVAHSFMRVKADIIRLQDEFMQVRELQIKILNRLAKLEVKKSAKSVKKKTVKKKIVKKQTAKKKPVKRKK